MSAATADYTPRKPASRFSASATSATTTTAGPDAPTTNARSHLHRHSASMPPPPPPSLSSSITTTPHGGSNNSRATTTMSLRSSTSARAPTWPTPSSRIAGANASNNHTASPPIPASPAPTSTTTLGLTPFATPAAAPRTRSSTTGSMHTGFGSSKSGSALRPSVRATPAPPSAPSGLPQSTGGLRSKRDVRGSGKPVPPTPARGASTASAHARAMYAPAMPLSPAPRLGSFIAADPRRGANSSTVSGISSHGIVGARRSSVPMATTPGPGELPTLPNLLTSAYFDRVEAEIAARSAIDRPGSVNSGPSFENGFDQYNLPAALPYPFVRPPPPLADLDDPAARDYFGAHFRVERALGRGSFSTVSSAVCTRHALSPWPAHDQAVAVKVPTKPYTSWRHRARMIEEVRVMRRLGVRGGHPNVLALHAAWEQRGALFLVLELCAGGTLAEHLERRAAVGLSETEIWAVLSDVAEGLAFIHARGVAHLDVKPANILLTVHGTCKIGDFGLA
ncbi:kinase-like domain-containing protein, partial [Blastocladiella britannica]